MLFICIIFYLSFAKPSTFKEAPSFFSIDKVAHVFLYFILGIILIIDFSKSIIEKSNNLKKILITIFFPVLMGGIIEISQEMYFKPRSAEWIDWFSDILGIGLSYVFMHYVDKKRMLKPL